MPEPNEDTKTDDQIVADAVNAGDQAGDQPGDGDAPFHYAEGLPGEGEVPEWFKSDKYKTVADQAKAYKDLEGKFGAFTGAPESFEVNLSEEMTELGIEIGEDDPIYSEAVSFATEANMSQEGFDKMINLYAMTKIAEADAIQQVKADEIKELGTNAESRINNLVAWGKANLPQDLFDEFEVLPNSAGAIKTLEKIVAMTRGQKIDPTDGDATSGLMSSEELRAMQFEKDEQGNYKMQTDKEFRKRFEKLAAQVWGSEEHNITIGT